MESIKEKRGWSKKQLEQAIERRKKVLAYMVDQNIIDYDSVVNIIKEFQVNQERLMKKLMLEEAGA
jgi:ribosome-binding protein aMBF1 (putative translation factor)